MLIINEPWKIIWICIQTFVSLITLLTLYVPRPFIQWISATVHLVLLWWHSDVVEDNKIVDWKRITRISRSLIILNILVICSLVNQPVQLFGLIILLIGAVYTICVLGKYPDFFEYYYFKDEVECRRKVKAGTWMSVVGLAAMVDPVLMIFCIWCCYVDYYPRG